MPSRLKVLLVALLASTVIPAAAARADSVALSEATPAETPFDVTDASLRWGMTKQASGRSHAPGMWNFFSAGGVADPGKANSHIPEAGWKQRAGTVAIEQGGKPATWAGRALGGQEFVFSKGVGTVDPNAGTARVAWTGAVSVIFYSGYLFFHLSNPVLEIAGGKGTLKATLTGFGGARDGGSDWTRVTPEQVTIADFKAVSLTGRGFSAIPNYAGVRTTHSAGIATGSFPQSFINYVDRFGMAPFWYGESEAKLPRAVTLSFDAARPVPPPQVPVEKPGGTIKNKAISPPQTVTRSVISTVTPASVPTTQVPVRAAVSPISAAFPVPQVPVVAAQNPATVQLAAASPRLDAARWSGWLGAGLFGLAALVLLHSFIGSPRERSRVL